jgi:hypothetical protein
MGRMIGIKANVAGIVVIHLVITINWKDVLHCHVGPRKLSTQLVSSELPSSKLLPAMRFISLRNYYRVDRLKIYLRRKHEK